MTSNAIRYITAAMALWIFGCAGTSSITPADVRDWSKTIKVISGDAHEDYKNWKPVGTTRELGPTKLPFLVRVFPRTYETLTYGL